MDGVRVRLDVQKNKMICSQTIPERLERHVFAAAVRRAIVKRVRDAERGKE